MIKPELIYKYYASKDFEPTLPEGVKFRHFRFMLANKGWRKVPKKIQNRDDLIKWIVKFGATDCFYGTSEWMNPHKVAAKGLGGSYHIADNLLFGNDLVFDIDAPDPINLITLDQARKSTWNIFHTMKNHPEFKFKYAAFSGHKGFRLVYRKPHELPENARKRLDFLATNRKLFIEALSKEIQENVSKKLRSTFYRVSPFWDKNITINPMCVIRVLGTVHSGTGYISAQIAPSSLRRSVKTILEQIPYITLRRPGIPKREMISEGRELPSSSRLLSLAKDVTGLASLPPLPFKYFITNRVLGIKRGFIPIFIYNDSQKYWGKEVVKLQKKYTLGHLYIFKLEKHIIVLSLKCMQKRQLQKVLNQSTSRTKHDFKKYHRVFAPYCLTPTEILRSDTFTGYLSRSHALYVSPMLKLKHEGCGWTKLELIKGIRGNNDYNKG